MSAHSFATFVSVTLLGCFFCRSFLIDGATFHALAYCQPQMLDRLEKLKSRESSMDRRNFFAGTAGIVSLAILPRNSNADVDVDVDADTNANANAVISSKYCAYGEGSDCAELAENNPLILELQRKSAANKQANIDSAKNAFYAKNYPDWFAAVGKTMAQKESDGTFVVLDNDELTKLWDEGKVSVKTPTTMGGKIKDVTQKPMLVIKE